MHEFVSNASFNCRIRDVNTFEGASEGKEVGPADGAVVGCVVGKSLGLADGELLGTMLGFIVGLSEGPFDGTSVGKFDG